MKKTAVLFLVSRTNRIRIMSKEREIEKTRSVGQLRSTVMRTSILID